MRYRLGPFLLDTTGALWRASKAVAIQPTPFKLLCYLVENHERCVPNAELMEQIWGEDHVQESSLTQAIRKVRKALGKPWIENRSRVGYQYAGPLARLGRPGILGDPRAVSSAFVGRDQELAQLEAMLIDATHAGSHICIEGLAGIGKTELALQLAHKLKHADAFPGGIFWIDAENPDLRGVWADAIATAYGVEARGPAERCRKLLDALSAGSTPTLVVLDNVESWEPGAEPGPLPVGSHIALLITTRVRNLAATRFRHLRLSGLEKPHDRRLLQWVAQRELLEGLEELLVHLEGHPQSIELAGAFLAHEPDATTYLATHRHDPDAVEREVQGSVRAGRTVDAALTKDWQRMDGSQREAWWLASFFDSAPPVSRRLAQECGIGLAALRRLEAFHLVQSDGEGRWTMHRAVRDFAQRHHATTPEREVALLLGMAPVLMAGRAYSTQEASRVHERAAAAGERAHQQEAVFRAVEGMTLSAFTRADWPRMQEGIERLAQLARKAPPAIAVPCALAVQNCRAFFHLYQGRPSDARAGLAQSVALYREHTEVDRMPGFEHLGVQALCYAGLVAHDAGELQPGLDFIKEAVRIAEATGSAERQALAYLFRAGIHETRRELDASTEWGERGLKLTAGGRFPGLHEYLSLSACRVSIARHPDLVETQLDLMRTYLQRLDEMGFWLGRPERLVVFAEACLHGGHRCEGADAVREGLHIVDESGDSRMAPELWRLRAELCTAPEERRDCLARALRCAIDQGGEWWALRAATAIVQDGDSSPAHAQAQATLKGFLARLSKREAELEDVRRARSALDATQRDITT